MAMEQRITDKPTVAQASFGRTTLALAIASFALELATVLALLVDNCSLATILAILAALFGGATVVFMTRSGDKPDPVFHDPPPGT
jgi:hypothetical protein